MQKETKGDEEMQWIRKDAWGFTIGIFAILLGIYEVVLYVNEAAGQRGAEILLYTGVPWIFVGLTNNAYIIIWWLRKRTGHIDTRD